MKKSVQWMMLAALSAVALLGVAAPATASQSSGPRAVTALPSDVNDFSFESFAADYSLDTDAEGRSTLRTVETLVALFPDFDQNHGILRALVNTYQGHPTDISIVSVTDENGTPRDWHYATEDESSGDSSFTEIVIRDDAPTVYVHGRQTYVITYDQHNVTDYFADTNDDEFYWDTNGTGWRQSFGSVSATVHVPADLAGHLTGQNACYRGYEGANAACEVVVEEGDGETLLSATVTEIQPFENMTLAIGFDPHTFVARDDRYFATPFGFLQVITAGASIGAGIWAAVLRATKLANGKGRPTIIAEYGPPKGVGLFTEALVIGKVNRAAAASFIGLAVDRNVRIIETPSTSWFSRKPVYTLELLNGDGLEDEEWSVVTALFGLSPVVGQQYTMTSTDTALSSRIRALVAATRKKAAPAGWLKKVPFGTSFFAVVLAGLGAVGSFVLAVLMGESAFGSWIPFAVLVPVVLATLFVFGTAARKPLSEKGAELRDHLKGLELYIRLAEADRLRVLQSPEGALRTPVAVDQPGEVLKVYEKLLPYAVLFSLEKRWAEELGRFYTENPPDWYSGSGAFNAAVFASSISSLSNSVATSYSGSSSSSSSGGSGGGGSSGGGGGGGGGGGV